MADHKLLESTLNKPLRTESARSENTIAIEQGFLCVVAARTGLHSRGQRHTLAEEE